MSQARPTCKGFKSQGLKVLAYLNLPNPTFLSVPIINPNMEFIGTRQKSRFWWVEVGLELRIRAECSGFGAPWDLIKHTV